MIFLCKWAKKQIKWEKLLSEMEAVCLDRH
jgi:hypothetical protein